MNLYRLEKILRQREASTSQSDKGAKGSDGRRVVGEEAESSDGGGGERKRQSKKTANSSSPSASAAGEHVMCLLEVEKIFNHRTSVTSS